MTEDELHALMGAADATPPEYFSKPHIVAALEAVRDAETRARRGLLAEHGRHYRALRRLIEARCEADGGHVVEEIGGSVSVFGDRWCGLCHRHFRRFTPYGRYRPELPTDEEEG